MKNDKPVLRRNSSLRASLTELKLETQNNIKDILHAYSLTIRYVIYTEWESVLYHGIKTPRSVLKNEAVGRVF